MRAFDADKLLDILDVMIVGHKSASDVYDVVDSMPTVDAEPVVRCKDCKWYEESKNPEIYPIRFCYRLGNDRGFRVGYNCDGNDFCSRGERREDVRITDNN